MAVRSEGSSNGWTTYRTRFLIRAIPLSEEMVFTDALGREHRGRKGDYLVESIEGVRSIAPRRVFEDVYVAIVADDESVVPDRAQRGFKVGAKVKLELKKKIIGAAKLGPTPPAVGPVSTIPAKEASGANRAAQKLGGKTGKKPGKKPAQPERARRPAVRKVS